MTDKKFDVVQWMAEQGKTSYRDEIAHLRKMIETVKAAVKETSQPAFSERLIRIYEDEIERITREAQYRYDDWVSDIDY